MEARTRAILAAGGGSRSRATSPAPSSRGHRRDRSSGGPETRFPIQTSPTAHDPRTPRTAVRHSLEVPNEPAAPVPTPAETPLQPITNGAAAVNSAPKPAQTSATYMPGMDDHMMGEIGVEKRNSLGRSAPAAGGRFAGRRPGALNRMSGVDQSKRDSVGSIDGGRVGVSLSDKPMDD